ncbi:type VI secretion system baseplate subunit TssG [Sphingomonas sp. PL-96]|uniref:type VI secretion system baseplate subunit TssG n=1 Tax=Sphingomonas sp. PL-96 TaxID=2887201 RepID=UPI001E480146|nr:type VI secretion system baseplate subunit TssG [Sphingomonas sp. PL-96]MCC2975689.1 type VI secretion system baseplate subunit TssG [Sphingomonas sp. PL-96]
MAAENRPASDHLSFLADAAGETKRFGLFPIARGAEARAPHLPRIGRARRPAQSVADFVQVPSLSFPDSTLAEVEVKNGRARVGGHWFGLTGPMGPLPLHMTEFAAFERRYARQRPFGRWLDVLAARMLQFFVRVWSDSQPTSQADRPDDDRFAGQLAQLTGAAEGVGKHAAFPASSRVHYAALFASRRSAGAIEDALTHLLGQPVQIREFQPRWREIEPEDRTRLGRQFARLGDEAMLGAQASVASDAFRVVIRPRTPHEYEALLPSGARFRVLAEALDAFAPSHLEWDVELEIDGADATPARLDGRARLGWTGWLGGGGTAVRRDAHLRRVPVRNDRTSSTRKRQGDAL